MAASTKGRSQQPKHKQSKNETKSLKRKRDQEDLDKLRQAVDEVVSEQSLSYEATLPVFKGVIIRADIPHGRGMGVMRINGTVDSRIPNCGTPLIARSGPEVYVDQEVQ